ncbi:MAG TPA: Hsp70 family protein [Gemmataceae bacterium]|jgi:molecular chaperone DnaK|nr:Hsp70 family protein [Gemmataceae bacterium]
MNPAVGVDLGTTNTVIGIQTDDSGPDILRVSQPDLERREREPKSWIKSAVLFESAHSTVVGAFAARHLKAFRSVKSRMGTRWRVQHHLPGAGELLVTAPYVSAHVLKLARQAVREGFPQWDQTALITVPASFNSAQRSDTLLAATMAGFARVDLLDEPTAAFYFHFDGVRDTRDFDRKQTILVFDFGGGTLDVSIIEVQKEGADMYIDTVGRSRYNNLGGDDVDYDIAAAMLACWRRENENKIDKRLNVNDLIMLFVRQASRYKEEVEDALAQDRSDLPEFRVDDVVETAGSQPVRVEFQRTLRRDQYEEISGRYFQEKSGLNIYRPLGEALAVAQRIRPGFSARDLDLVLYTGGASQMASARSALESYFAPTPCLPISQDEQCHTVALGAAACRYDDVHRRQSVRMVKRLLETIFTRAGQSPHYVPLVPLDSEPAADFQDSGQQFRTPRRLIRIVHPLFRGVSETDQQLSPIGDLRCDLDDVVERETPYRIAYRVTPDMTLEFRIILEGGGPLPFNASIELGTAGTGPDALRPLCAVNAR